MQKLTRMGFFQNHHTLINLQPSTNPTIHKLFTTDQHTIG